MKLIHETPRIDWLLLTKRPQNAQSLLSDALSRMVDLNEAGPFSLLAEEWLRKWIGGDAPSNVWVGVSVEDQKRAGERIPELLKIPAKVRFLSVEPMLESISLDRRWQATGTLSHIDWVIFGGESGPNARPCDTEWIRDGVKQCRRSGVPAFVKQLGSHSGVVWSGSAAGLGISLAIRHNKGGDPTEWPEDLRVREFPNV